MSRTPSFPEGSYACWRCSSVVTPGSSFCTCGYPTKFASFDERTKYEVKRWLEWKRPA